MPTYEFRAPNGKRISVNSKDGSTPTEGEVYGMFQKAYPDDEAFQETVLERIGSAVGSAAQSAVGMGVKALEYFGKVAGNVPDTSLGRQTPIAVDQLRRSQSTVDPVLEGAKAAETAVAEAVPTLPQARESFITGDIPSAVGSLAGGVASGLVGGPAVAMGVMFGAEAQDAYDREIARQQKAGEQKNEDKAMFKATLYGTGATAIEYGLGAGYILRKIGEKFGKKAVGEVAEKVAETGWEKVAGALREGGNGGLAGFVEETAQSALQQKIVEGTVNWREAFREGAAGAVGQGGVATAVGLIPQSSQAVKESDDAMKEVVGEPGKIEGVPEAVQAANTPTEAPVEQAKPAAQGANEEVQKGQQKEVLSAGTASMPPVPERVDQIMEQLRLTGDPASTKAATLITPGSPIPAPTEGLVSVDTQHGTVIYNPNKITAQQVAQAASGEVFDGRVLGMASGATPIAGTTVVSTSTPAAPDVIAEVVQDTPSAIAEATIAQQKAVPGGDTQIKAASDVANERRAPRIEPPIESRDQTAPSRSVAWDYETITTTHEARSKWADEQVAKFKPDELRQAAKSAVEEPRITEDKRLILVSKLTKKALQLGDIETSQYLGAALQQLSQQAGQSLESMKQVNDELTAYAPLLAYVNAVKPKGDPVAVPSAGPIREAWNELKRALGNTMSLGAVADPEAIAKAQIDVYKALFRLAKVAAQEGVKSAKEFAERFGLKLTDSVKHAWQQAKTEQDPSTPSAPILKDAGRLVISEPKKRRAKAQEFSQEVYDKMKGLAEKAAKMPEGLQKNEVLQEMTKQLEDSLGLGWKDALLGGDWWYASVLMRLGTFANVAVGSGTTGVAWNLLGALDAATAGRSPKVALRMLSAFWQGVMDGGLVAKEIVQKGNYALLPDYQRRVEKFLLGKKGGKGDALEAMLRRGNPLGVLAYTRRIMAALDYIAAQGTRDAGVIYASMAAGDQASLEASQKRFDKQLSAQASEQARNELGKAATALQVRLRAREILEDGIDSEIKESALKLARRAAQNADPVGLSGVIYKALSRLPLWVKAPTGLAFLRAGLNMVQTASDFVPGIGAVTYARSSKAFQDRFKDSEHGKFLALDLPPEQRRLAAASQVVGVGILMAGAAWALDDDEKKEIEISGGWRNVTPQQAKELRAVGEQPYAIKIGDKWWSYRQTPFAAAIAMIGAIRDNRRFDKEKWDEKSVMDKVLTAAYSGVAYIKDIAALSQVAKIMGGDAGRTEDASIDQTNQFFAQTFGRYLSGYIPSIVKEAEDFMDPTVRAPLRDDFAGQWIKNLPVTFQEAVGKVNRPALNFLGEPIKATRPPLRSLASVEKPEPEYRLVAKWMSEGLFIPQANRTAQVVDRNTGEKRRMTDEEFYAYQREYGQFFKEVLTSDIKEFEGMDREQASRFLSNIAPKASKVARAKLD